MNIDYNAYKLSFSQKRNFLMVAYLFLFMISMLFYHSILLSFACGFLSLFLIEFYRKHLMEKRKEMLFAQFKDLLYSLSASIATGRQMTEALAEALENLKLIYKEDTPMVMELHYIVKSTGENRGNEEELLVGFAKRSGLEDIRDFVDVYLACRETGGNMEEVISHAGEILTDKITIEREIKTLTAQKQFEGNIITIMPIAVIFFLNVFSPDYLEAMYITIGGRLIMTLALAGIGIAYYMTLKLTKIEV